jgi:hypothetical protein
LDLTADEARGCSGDVLASRHLLFHQPELAPTKQKAKISKLCDL